MSKSYASVEELMADPVMQRASELFKRCEKVCSGLFAALSAAPSMPFFTGWKFSETEPHQGYIGQFCCRIEGGRRVAWANLPGLESGVCLPDGRFDIGTERLPVDISDDDLRYMLELGFSIMVAEILKAANEGDDGKTTSD